MLNGAGLRHRLRTGRLVFRWCLTNIIKRLRPQDHIPRSHWPCQQRKLQFVMVLPGCATLSWNVKLLTIAHMILIKSSPHTLLHHWRRRMTLSRGGVYIHCNIQH
ncbi:hypothetical protein BDR03DRAFT_975846 [Suillus americanus]|nr:hypothetical protein BDR03DRAFT_975846 [Suillus americanus]